MASRAQQTCTSPACRRRPSQQCPAAWVVQAAAVSLPSPICRRAAARTEHCGVGMQRASWCRRRALATRHGRRCLLSSKRMLALGCTAHLGCAFLGQQDIPAMCGLDRLNGSSRSRAGTRAAHTRHHTHGKERGRKKETYGLLRSRYKICCWCKYKSPLATCSATWRPLRRSSARRCMPRSMATACHAGRACSGRASRRPRADESSKASPPHPQRGRSPKCTHLRYQPHCRSPLPAGWSPLSALQRSPPPTSSISSTPRPSAARRRGGPGGCVQVHVWWGGVGLGVQQ